MDVSVGKNEARNLFHENKTLPDVIGSNKTNQGEASSGRPYLLAFHDEQND